MFVSFCSHGQTSELHPPSLWEKLHTNFHLRIQPFSAPLQGKFYFKNIWRIVLLCNCSVTFFFFSFWDVQVHARVQLQPDVCVIIRAHSSINKQREQGRCAWWYVMSIHMVFVIFVTLNVWYARFCFHAQTSVESQNRSDIAFWQFCDY